MNDFGGFYRKKVALVTGASSGIGEELARQLSAAGAKVTLAARRAELLHDLAQKIAATGAEPPLIAACDVTRDGDLERTVQATISKWGQLDVVIANAGFGVVGEFAKLTLEDYRRQLETNLFGVMRTLYAALPQIQKAKGNIAIISSVAGWVSTPGVSPYSMSKFALRALAEAITTELKPRSVKVTLISPGFIVSNIRRVDNAGEFHPGAKDVISPRLQMSTGKAASQILWAIARGKREKIITFHGKLVVAMERFAPWLLRAVTRKMLPKFGE
jgi:short-subunit dehydrogenase